MTSETGIPGAALERGRPFSGAKVALFLGARLAVVQRDDIPGIPYPGLWDLPGGGREPGESPRDCVIRETAEELSLILRPRDFRHARAYRDQAGAEVWFWTARLPPACVAKIRLGDEGQGWALMPPRDYLAHPAHIPPLAARLRRVLGG